MAAADVYKKAVYFLLVAGSVLLALVVLSLLEEVGRNYLVAHFAFDLDPRGRLIPRPGPDAPDMMTATGISLVENVLRIFKVVLWMVFVVSVIRLLTRLMFETVLRSAAQTEIASLLKTVLSVVIYIVAWGIALVVSFLSLLLIGKTIVGMF